MLALIREQNSARNSLLSSVGANRMMTTGMVIILMYRVIIATDIGRTEGDALESIEFANGTSNRHFEGSNELRARRGSSYFKFTVLDF